MYKNMLELSAHPNTRAILEAWKRLSQGDARSLEGPMANDYPDLVGRLFIIQRAAIQDYSFRVAGAGLEELFGRELADHNFLSLWRPVDKLMVTAAIESALQESSPSLLQAQGETLDGRSVKTEISFAPLDGLESARPRVLGLYQTLNDEGQLRGRPIWRHYATGVYPPKPRNTAPRIHLVASNDL